MAAEHFTETVDGVDVASDASRLAPGCVIAARYAVVSLLGGGGSSFVYRAVDRLLGTDVALKILRSDRVTSHALARMRREVALARRIQSPHVLRIHDIGETDDGTAFLTMEIIDGETLADRLARGPLPVDEMVRLTSEILEGLAAIHNLGIVHRDIKPSNILVDRAGHAIVGDLGLARQFDSSEPKLTHTEALVGTLHYLSPEQALGLKPDARSDLYSLGATLFECLTGQLPFERETVVGTLASHISERAPSLRTLRPEVPGWLDKWVLHLLEKEPRNRPQSAWHALEALRRRRVPVRWGRLLRAVPLLIGVFIVSAAGWWFVKPGPCASFLPTEKGFRAVDAKGRTLWSYDGALAKNAWLLNGGTDRAVVAVIPGDAIVLGAEERHQMLLLDPATGRVTEKLVLPQADAAFEGFDNLYSLEGEVIDANRDGSAELMIEFTHTYWPWYAVHFDSATRTPHLLYVSTGHQSAFATADVDGDGRDEFIFAGRDNVMGWYASLAVVGIESRRPTETVLNQSPCSPIVARSSICIEARKGWHTLLRRGWPVSISADPSTRTIEVRYDSGPSERVRYDGRPVGATVDAATAQSDRKFTYTVLRAVARLEESGNYGLARDEVRAARASAGKSGDPFLVEWVERLQARLLIRAGDVSAGEALARSLMKHSDAAPDIAFDVGRALYLAGRPGSAVEYFREGLMNDREAAGRLKYEFVEAMLFALVGDNRVDEALSFVAFAPVEFPAYVGAPGRDVYRAAILWLTGRDFDPPALDFTRQRPSDLAVYWNYEFEWKRTANAKSMLPRVQSEIAKGGTTTGLLQSLEAVLLDDLGRHREAVIAIDATERWIAVERDRDMIARAHETIVRDRYNGIHGKSNKAGSEAVRPAAL